MTKTVPITMDMIIKAKIQANSKKNEIVGNLPDGTVKIKIAAPAIEGRANIKLIKFLSKKYHVPKSQIQILHGENNKIKLIKISQ